MKYPSHLYKVRGSLILWTLHNNICNEFVVWILSKDLDLHLHNNHFTGVIKKQIFIKKIIKELNCCRSTAIKYINSAIKYKFLTFDDDYYYITGKNQMSKYAFNHHQIMYDNKESNFRPKIIFGDDREYTIMASDLIDTVNINNTKAILYGFMCVHCSKMLFSRETHAKLLGVKRNTVIRLSKKSLVNEFNTFILLDPSTLVLSSKVKRLDIVKYFSDAEYMYRTNKFSKKTVTSEQKKRVNSKTVNSKLVGGKTYLAVQLPNTYTSEQIKKEVPIKFENLVGVRQPGMGACSKLSPMRQECVSYQNKKFLSSVELSGSLSFPKTFINRYLGTLREIMDNGNCREYILHQTGGTNLVFPSCDSVNVYRYKVNKSDDTRFLMNSNK